MLKKEWNLPMSDPQFRPDLILRLLSPALIAPVMALHVGSVWSMSAFALLPAGAPVTRAIFP